MTRLFKIFILCLVSWAAKSQSPLQLDCNTVFVCVDSSTYRELFSNDFVKDTLAICRELTSSTLEDRYTGKYFIGKSATLEIFQPSTKNQMGERLGDIGIEFKTRLVGDRGRVLKRAKQLGIGLDTNTVFYPTEEGVISWYAEAKLPEKNQNLGLSVIDYTAAFLNFRGFTWAEIRKPMTYAYFNTRLSGGRAYPRLLNEITAVVLEVDSLNLKRLRAYSKLNQLKEVGGSFQRGSFQIQYRLVEGLSGARLVALKLGLLVDQRERVVQLSERLQLQIYGRTAELSFLK